MPHLPRVALAGVPNCGKSALFNGLTGSRQKVANYAGATVERRWGRVRLDDGTRFHIVDLPGTYSLDAASRDQEITRDVLLGQRADEAPPDALICVMDATNLRLHLRLVLDVKRLGIPFVVALNMVDLAERNGTRIDIARLSQELGAPVVPTVAVRR
ncbi:MAG: ferrous iron transporter B, partial [Blastochloris sp.]|nr:ferrous iron transporter B [Blastochloris sp.]